MQIRDYFVQCQQIQNAGPSISPLHILHPVFNTWKLFYVSLNDILLYLALPYQFSSSKFFSL